MIIMKTPVEMKKSLLQFASLLSHQRFFMLLVDDSHRFDQFSFMSDVVKDQSLSLLNTLRVVAKKSSSDFTSFRKPIVLDDKEYIKSILAQVSGAIHLLSSCICDEAVKKSDSGFTVRRNESFLAKTDAFFGYDFGLPYSSCISSYTSGYKAIDTYNIPSLYYFVGSYLKLRLTCLEFTNNPIIEALINHVLLRGKDYVCHGFPIDLFAHDVANIQGSISNIDGVFLNDEVLLTKAVIRNSYTKPDGNYSTYFDFNDLKQTKLRLVS